MANEVVNAPNKTWELSLYELHRTPQEAITDNTEIAVSPRSLHSELMCPICLDMLKNTMTTKECLHRFCQDCIITALRSGNKECPTCRKKLVSKRSLRPDPNFDALISKIYPSRDEYEAHQARVLAKLNKQHSTSALTSRYASVSCMVILSHPSAVCGLFWLLYFCAGMINKRTNKLAVKCSLKHLMYTNIQIYTGRNKIIRNVHLFLHI